MNKAFFTLILIFVTTASLIPARKSRKHHTKPYALKASDKTDPFQKNRKHWIKVGEIKLPGLSSPTIVYKDWTTGKWSRIIDLAHRNFSKNFDEIIDAIVKRCPYVTCLILSNCQLHGLMPHNIRKLKYLVDLDLSNNNFKYFPHWIPWMTQLEQLDLSGNDFERIGAYFYHLQRLHFLNLSNISGLQNCLPVSSNGNFKHIFQTNKEVQEFFTALTEEKDASMAEAQRNLANQLQKYGKLYSRYPAARSILLPSYQELRALASHKRSCPDRFEDAILWAIFKLKCPHKHRQF